MKRKGENQEDWKIRRSIYNKKYRDIRKLKLGKEGCRIYNKKHNDKHKESSKIRASVRYECECNGRYTVYNKKAHVNSKKHQFYLQADYTDDDDITWERGFIIENEYDILHGSDDESDDEDEEYMPKEVSFQLNFA